MAHPELGERDAEEISGVSARTVNLASVHPLERAPLLPRRGTRRGVCPHPGLCPSSSPRQQSVRGPSRTITVHSLPDRCEGRRGFWHLLGSGLGADHAAGEGPDVADDEARATIAAAATPRLRRESPASHGATGSSSGLFVGVFFSAFLCFGAGGCRAAAAMWSFAERGGKEDSRREQREHRADRAQTERRAELRRPRLCP